MELAQRQEFRHRIGQSFQRLGTHVVVVAVVMTSIVLAPAARAQSDPSDRAKQIVAARIGVDVSKLSIVNSATASYPELQTSAQGFKVIDPSVPGRIHEVNLSPAGDEVDANALATAELDLARQRRGALDPQLFAAVEKAAPSDVFSVVLELSEEPYYGPQPPAGLKPSQAEIEAFLARATTARRAAVARLMAPVRAKLQTEGVSIIPLTDQPFATARVSASVLRRIARFPEIRRISLDLPGSPSLGVSREAIGADGVEGRGFDGAGRKVAVIEANGGQIATGNPYLSGTVIDTQGSCVSDHTVNVAGIVGSTHGVQRGIAPGASLRVGGACNWLDSFFGALEGAQVRAKDWGATVINHSWGLDTGATQNMGHLEPYQDAFVRDFRTTITVSAGNRAQAPGCPFTDGLVTGPAKAYSVIAVGGSDTRGTPQWDDAMYACSSYVDPNSWRQDREKPEVTAPGTNVVTTKNQSPWIQQPSEAQSGTSFAAPMVAGAAALLQQRGILSTWPESVKAILMASALTNIEGDQRLSEKDGAGQVQVNRADDIVAAGQYVGLNHSCADPANRVIFTMDLEAYARTRVAIAWGTDTAYSDYANRPSADIDLQVTDSLGVIWASSASWDNTYEIVDFVPTSSGSYTVTAITAPERCYLSPRFLGGAWIQDPGFAPGVARYTSGSRLDAFVRGRDNLIYQRTNTGSSWTTTWSDLGAPTTSGAGSNPYAVWWQNNNRLDVFVRGGSDGSLYHRYFCWQPSGIACTISGWSTSWFSLGGVITEGPPTAAWTNGNRIDVFVRGGAGVKHILWRYWDGTQWYDWVDLGPAGGATSAPAAVWWQSDTRMDLYIRGADHLLWSRYFCTQIGPYCPSTGWSDWYKVPLPAASASLPLGSSPAITAQTTGNRIDVFVRGTDNLMWQTYWSAAAGWTEWTKLFGTNFISGPGAGWWADNSRVDVLGQGTDNRLWHRSSADGVWRAIDVYP